MYKQLFLHMVCCKREKTDILQLMKIDLTIKLL